MVFNLDLKSFVSTYWDKELDIYDEKDDKVYKIIGSRC